MILNTSNIKSNTKLLSILPTGISDSFIYLSPVDKKMYLANSTIAIAFSLDMENEPDDIDLVLSRQEFFHVVSSCDRISINSNYDYNTGLSRGSFSRNDSFLEVLPSIKTMFILDDSEFTPIFSVSGSLISDLTKALVFTNQDDANPSSRGIHFDSGSIAASSLFRIYMNKSSVNTSAFISSSIAKFILACPENTIISKGQGVYKISNETITIIFAGMVDIAPLPLKEEKFISIINSIKEDTEITLNYKEALDKLDFISFFANKKINGLTKIRVDKDSRLCYYSVDTNTVELPFEGTINESLEFYFSAPSLKEVLQKVGKGVETFKIYCNSSSKLFIVELEKDQIIIFTKINL